MNLAWQPSSEGVLWNDLRLSEDYLRCRTAFSACIAALVLHGIMLTAGSPLCHIELIEIKLEVGLITPFRYLNLCFCSQNHLPVHSFSFCQSETLLRLISGQQL